MPEPTISLRKLKKDLARFEGHLRMVECKVSGDVLSALVEVVEALREMHEEECGCRDPGNWDVCENIAFRVLARFTEEGT